MNRTMKELLVTMKITTLRWFPFGEQVSLLFRSRGIATLWIFLKLYRSHSERIRDNSQTLLTFYRSHSEHIREENTKSDEKAFNDTPWIEDDQSEEDGKAWMRVN